MTAVVQWLLIDWKLKALSLGLTVLLLGAVSFSDSPVQAATVNAHISYDNTPRTGLVLNNPPATTKATIIGPAAVLKDIVAYAIVDSPVNANSREQLATLIRFERGGSAFDLGSTTTIPAITWSPQTVTAIVQAKQGTLTIQVALVDALPTAPPPAGYHVTAVVITPQLITLSGAPDVVGGIQSITLSAGALASFTSDHTFSVRIPQADNRIRMSTTTAQITYKIARNPAVNPSP